MNHFSGYSNPMDAVLIADTAQAKSRAESAEQRSKDLEQRLGHLTLVCAALWELVGERTGLTEADLLAKVADLDSRDGQINCSLGSRVGTCPKCGRKSPPKYAACMYCGHAVGGATVFERI